MLPFESVFFGGVLFGSMLLYEFFDTFSYLLRLFGTFWNFLVFFSSSVWYFLVKHIYAIHNSMKLFSSDGDNPRPEISLLVSKSTPGRRNSKC